MPPYKMGELSLRHLPDVSDTSFSFQIPGSLAEENLLSAELDFLQYTEESRLSHITSPVKRKSTDAHISSQVTSKPTIETQQRPAASVAPLEHTRYSLFPTQTSPEERQEEEELHHEGERTLVKPKKKPITRIRRSESSRSYATISNSGTPKSRPKLIIPAVSHLHPEASPSAVHLKALQEEVEALSENNIMNAPLITEESRNDIATVKEHYGQPNGVAIQRIYASSSLQEERATVPNERRRERRTRTSVSSKQKVVIEGGITKKRSTIIAPIKPPEKQPASSSRVSYMQETGSIFSPPIQSSNSKALDGDEPISIKDTSPASPDTEGNGHVVGSVAARLLKYDHGFISSFGQTRPLPGRGTTLGNEVHNIGDVPCADPPNICTGVKATAVVFTSKTGTHMGKEILTTVTDSPLTLSQLSPRKESKISRKVTRPPTPPPPASPPARNNNLTPPLSPLRSSTKRPVSALIYTDNSGDFPIKHDLDDPSSAGDRRGLKKSRTEYEPKPDYLSFDANDCDKLDSDEPIEMTVNGRNLQRKQGSGLKLELEYEEGTQAISSGKISSEPAVRNEPTKDPGETAAKPIRHTKSRSNEGRNMSSHFANKGETISLQKVIQIDSENAGSVNIPDRKVHHRKELNRNSTISRVIGTNARGNAIDRNAIKRQAQSGIHSKSDFSADSSSRSGRRGSKADVGIIVYDTSVKNSKPASKTGRSETSNRNDKNIKPVDIRPIIIDTDEISDAVPDAIMDHTNETNAERNQIQGDPDDDLSPHTISTSATGMTSSKSSTITRGDSHSSKTPILPTPQPQLDGCVKHLVSCSDLHTGSEATSSSDANSSGAPISMPDNGNPSWSKAQPRPDSRQEASHQPQPLVADLGYNNEVNTKENSSLPVNKLPVESSNKNRKGKTRAVSSSILLSTRQTSSRQAVQRVVSSSTTSTAVPFVNATVPVEFKFHSDPRLERTHGGSSKLKSNSQSESCMSCIRSETRPESRPQSRAANNPNIQRPSSRTHARSHSAQSQNGSSQSHSQSQSSRSQSQSRSQRRYQNYHPAPDFKSIHAQLDSSLAKKKENIHPTVPHPPQFETDKRMKERKEFDAMIKEKEREKERLEEEQRKLLDEEEEREVRELRKKLVPKANEVPKWYQDAPRKKERKDGSTHAVKDSLRRSK